MATIRLVHWNETEAIERADRLRAMGYRAETFSTQNSSSLAPLRDDSPDAFVIDLSRLPSHGRAVAAALRQSRATRFIPLVFVEGEPEKTERVRRMFPDAAYTTWGRVRADLKRALANPPVQPIVPKSGSGPNSGVPLWKKLGIKAGTTVALIGAPPKFEATLRGGPAGVTLSRAARRADMVLWFVTSRRELERREESLRERVGTGGLWLAWPKKASGVKSDVDGNVLREVCLAAGLVDNKVCAIDATWSGLRLARKKAAK